ncbi:MAG: hypothetical protein ABI220_04435 [Candidatus Saccharimonadales bacterium]
MRGKYTEMVVYAVLLVAGSFFMLLNSPKASAAINPQINFQGKLTNPDGTNVTDGTYSITFNIYSVASGGSSLWTETQTSVSVSSGIFQVALGSVNATLATAVDFSTSPLYLGVKVGSDPEMTPRIQFTAAPYAFNANELNGLSSNNFVQFANGIQADASTNSSIAINKTAASGNILQLQKNGSNVFSITNSGTIQVASATYQTNLFTIQNGVSSLPIIPGSYLPSLTVAVQETTGSRPLFFGYVNGAAWDAYMDAGACGAFTQMCLAFGSGASGYTALENVGTTLNIGGGDDGNFTNLAFKNSGTANFSGGTVTANGLTVNSGTLGQLSINSGASVPAADQVVIDNSGSSGVTTAGVDGLNVHYKGGAAAVEAAGMRVDYTPGTTSGGIWSGMRIVENTAPAAGVTSYGLKLEGGGTSPGTDVAIEVASGWDIGIDIQSGGMQLAASAATATVPAAGNLKIYAKDIAGRIIPKWIGPAGVDTPFQANLGFNRVAWTNPSGGTSLTTAIVAMGSAFTDAGTLNNPTPTATNLLTSTRSTTFSTTTTAGTLASHRQKTLQVWRGNQAGYGGFFYTIRFGTDTLATGNRAFVGLSDSIAAPTNVDPTTSATIGKIGVAINDSTGNWKFVTNTKGTAPTSTDLGTAIPVNTTDLYELVLFSAPNGTTIGYRVTDLSTGGQISGSVATNLPANNDFMAPQFWITNNTTAGLAVLDFNGWYLESDN